MGIPHGDGINNNNLEEDTKRRKFSAQYFSVYDPELAGYIDLAKAKGGEFMNKCFKEVQVQNSS